MVLGASEEFLVAAKTVFRKLIKDLEDYQRYTGSQLIGEFEVKRHF